MTIQTSDRTFKTFTRRGWDVEVLEICYMPADSMVFKIQIYCSFLQMVGMRWGQKIGHFVRRHKWMTPQTNFIGFMI